MTLVVRDDADVVAWNLDYHLSQGVDVLLVTSHRASSTTRAVLAEYARRGKAHVFEEAGEAFLQGHWVTRMARFAHAELSARWILHTDADEFWWPSQSDLRSALELIPVWAGGISVQRRNAQPVERDDAPFFERMVVFTRASVNGLGEPLQPKVCHRGAADAVIADGNHTVSSRTLGPIVPSDALEVLHFPMRTYTQFAAKIATGARALALSNALSPATGHVWRHLEVLRLGGELPGFYERHLVDPDRVRRGAANDNLTYDDRLLRYLRATSA